MVLREAVTGIRKEELSGRKKFGWRMNWQSGFSAASGGRELWDDLSMAALLRRCIRDSSHAGVGPVGC